jgi:hypothetical protein
LDVKTLEITSLLGLKSIYDIQLSLNPDSRIERNYLVFDSFDRLNPESTTEFKYAYVETADQSLGTVGTVGVIRNLISMKLYQPIFPSLVVNSNSNRISILIKELATQSFVASGTVNYHWLLRTVYSTYFDSQTASMYIEGQTDTYNDGVFNFRKPVTELQSLTFIFGDPLNTISIPICQDYCTFTYGNPTILTFEQSHPTLISSYTTTQGSAFIRTFTTNDPSNPLDMNIIMAFNNPYGFGITVLSPTSISVDIDSTLITPKPGLKCIIYLSQFRFVFAIEMSYINDGK